MRLAGVVTVVWVCLMLTACPKLEQQAYRTVVGANAFIKSVRTAHPECATSTSNVCATLTQATAAKDSLIDAVELYCGGPSFDAGGPCQAPAKGTAASTQAVDKLQAALGAWNVASSDLKKAVGQ